MVTVGVKVGSITYWGGSRSWMRRPAASPLIVPPLWLRMRMRTWPLVPMGCDVVVPVRKTSTSTPEATDRVLSSAVSPAVTPVEVTAIPPVGGCAWQPHSTSETVFSRLVQESVTLPTR